MRRQVRQRWEWCLIVSAVCFLVLMGLVAAGVTHGLDQDILNAIRAFKTTQHTRVITGITNTGGPTATLIETLVIAVILVLRRQPWQGGIAVATILMGDGFYSVIKSIVKRPRPLHQILPTGGYSFPSGHTLGTTLVALVIWTLFVTQWHRKWLRWTATVVLILWVLLVGFSRLYLQVHFPTDVLGGVLGAILLWSGIRLLGGNQPNS
ncbi:hypothetical protein AYR62_00220 [Secundilactobacillus paracollinoides]|uniref:Phosphatidic acid phosphatase type 2/haloperoxidase domain-containing protein n=1 Tax=Secundilactobacillus paracollinoides TaxID=240427 RepID=A0A1B2IVT8_9LACO|nr:phosphatase PAP2 family protein [Secundilactobacillus paracollinoides]ANZ62677.1 hypothetical protein AYR62_00220 [Secundilactobacillus paracollinoides]ANZ66163.1 hypothetical protein AYR63_02730 [Secundilactobacillus paracollinoides]